MKRIGIPELMAPINVWRVDTRLLEYIRPDVQLKLYSVRMEKRD